MLDSQTLVSVLLLTEDAADDDIFNAFKNITEQTHKKTDIIISTFRDDIENLKERCSELHLDVRWAQQTPGGDFIGELLELADGEIVFYKTVNNCLWYPRHIEAHIEGFIRDKGTKWAMSHVENRNIDQHDSPYNALSFRIDNPPHPDSITLDEICHYAKSSENGIEVDWTACLVQKDDVPLFYPGYAVKQWLEEKHRGSMPSEITVIQWMKPDGGAPNQKELEDFYQQVGVPQTTEIKEEPIETEEGIEIKRVLPTVVGNRHFKDYTDSILQVIDQTEDVQSIGLKRSIGMGDVTLTEPIIKKLKQKYPNAKITFYTAKPDIIKYFKTQPDDIVTIDENDLVKDTLHDTPNDIKFDLDLSYESREESPFVDSYADVVNVKFDNAEDRCVQLVCDEKPLEEEKYVVVCGDGSGWEGKTWSIEKYAEVIKHIKTLGYNVYETGVTHTEESSPKYHECEFDKLVNLIANCEFYVGTDNGPMHIARGFEKPCFVIAGAALPYYTNPNRKNIFYIQDSTHPGFGIKHKQFFNLTDQGLTFMPYFPDDPTCGLNNIQPKHVIKAFDKYFEKPLSIIDNSPCDYYLNVSGNLVLRDVIPGFAYYQSKETGIIQRENPYYHPDQRLDISQVYANDRSNIWLNNFTPLIKDWKEKKGNSLKVLDVGCSLGILVEGANNEGDDIRGVDINYLSVKAGKSAYPKIAHLLSVNDFTQPQEEKGIYDVVVLSDILSHVGNPLALLKNALQVVKDDGFIYINVVNFGCTKAKEEFNRWDGVGVGENITLFNRESFAKLADIVNIDYENYRTDEEDEMMFLRCTKRG